MLHAVACISNGLGSTLYVRPEFLRCKIHQNFEEYPPVCSTDRFSAFYPFALAQCSVDTRYNSQITVNVSDRVSRADRGQRTWVLQSSPAWNLDSGGSAERAVCIGIGKQE